MLFGLNDVWFGYQNFNRIKINKGIYILVSSSHIAIRESVSALSELLRDNLESRNYLNAVGNEFMENLMNNTSNEVKIERNGGDLKPVEEERKNEIFFKN